MIRRATLMAMALSIASQASARRYEPPPMPAGYDDPGPQPEDQAAQIASRLRETLADPYSVRDFAICRSRVIPAGRPLYAGDAWQRAHWVTSFQLNARNRLGGYVGLQDGIATYEEGRVVRASLGPLIDERHRRAIEARGECNPVGADETQRLFSSR
jgi:hypothetical protein